uniref:Uncharacterized protein n=1 Tax=Parascaris univalens TaxID=6257 RepID=A0A915CDJ3_PARUN
MIQYSSDLCAKILLVHKRKKAPSKFFGFAQPNHSDQRSRPDDDIRASRNYPLQQNNDESTRQYLISRRRAEALTLTLSCNFSKLKLVEI